jgi:hypothetical protein
MGWTVVSEIWLFFCILVAVVYPVVDGHKVLSRAFTLFYQISHRQEGCPSFQFAKPDFYHY